MITLQVTWIIPDGTDLDRRIDAIGGAGWHHTIDVAILNILRGTHHYWVQIQGRRVSVMVAQKSGRNYLKTETDYFEPNNLLALPHKYWAA
ncbi:MAG: DUF3892 domain-containing protein [Pseudomonadota bacterium]